MNIPTRYPALRLLASGALCVLLTGCGDGDGSMGPGSISVDLPALFAAATQAEVDAVEQEWAARPVVAEGIAIERDTVVQVGGAGVRVRIVSHDVGATRHYGAILAAEGLSVPSPVLVYAHPGDGGAAVEDVLLQLSLAGDAGFEFVWVVPSFRSESLRFNGASWLSTGVPSLLDRDVDDALSLLEVALEVEPLADPGRIGVLGLSRGASVAMLMGVRDERIDRVVAFSGLTDFFDVFIRDVVAESLAGMPRDLVGLGYLDDTYIQPLGRGDLTIAEVRPELVRRSVVLFAERLPMLQLHHGDADQVVDVTQAQSLAATMSALGRSEPEFEAFIYAGGTHNPFSLTASFPRAIAFLEALLDP